MLQNEKERENIWNEELCLGVVNELLVLIGRGKIVTSFFSNLGLNIKVRKTNNPRDAQVEELAEDHKSEQVKHHALFWQLSYVDYSNEDRKRENNYGKHSRCRNEAILKLLVLDIFVVSPQGRNYNCHYYWI